ncbi:polysaccharide pyruvyl transferase family protein [Winogradskyella helgolandensis]|uniref:polysaccharide pyruvyl transferase family protein n=1 Tax=Winogradskyella helgolandensis TaxID=2697010 RepID=UPI0015CE2629|nr:polysaccharide pyruvyl transferase family protein [Winogradskyella helgolandensis]
MTKLKIGILTLPINNNYGGIIQLAALYNFIESNGFEAVWIDKRHPESVVKFWLKKIIEINPLYNIYDPKNFKTIKLFRKQVAPFFKEYLSVKTNTAYTSEYLKEVTKDLDCVIVGSDQVWRLEYIKENYPTYFLDFVSSKTKKIAYAASFGKDFWEGKTESISKIESLIQKFDLVSTREEDGLKICKESFNYEKAVHTLDPSFLPDVSFYEKMIKGIDFSHKIELFNYVLDASEKSTSIVDEISNRMNLKIDKIYLNASNSLNSPHLIENWLSHFYYSNFIITDSFHGLVFSIIFNKQFIIIGNKSRGLSRFNSLLKLLNLENRLIDIDQFKIEDIALLNEKIDYLEVNKKLNMQKEISKTYLLNAITN